jgi:hypothetical protein
MRTMLSIETFCSVLSTPLKDLLKPCIMFQMVEYKRNQVEEAISAVLEPRSPEPGPQLLTRIKRLLETDRALGRVRSSADPERANYAFYRADPPGSGVEVWFSAYEAFSLLNGLRLMGHGWPQSFAVSVMRRVRPELEKQHARVLNQDPKWLFDQEAIRRNARAGDMAFDNQDPVLLTIVSKPGAVQNDETEPFACAVCRGPEEAHRFLWKAGKGVGAGTMFDLVGLAHRLANALSRTTPSQRGRS